MSSVPAGGGDHIDEAQLRRDAASVGHPLARALLVLTFTTGLVDAASYLGLGRVFTANMTGNVVLLGFGIAGASGLPVLAPLISLAAFVVGAGAGGIMIRRVHARHTTIVVGALGVEAAMIATAAILAAVLNVHTKSASAYVIIALLACALGFRNAVVKRVGVADLTTTVLTMTLTGLASESALIGGPGHGSLRRLAAVLAMLIGAVAGALLLEVSLALPLALAAAMAVATGSLYLPAARRLTSRGQ